jgi:hypothetical protein
MAKREKEESGCWLRVHDGKGGYVAFDRSPGFVFVMMARNLGGEAHGLSKLTGNWCDQWALSHAIEFGFRFEIDDAETLANLGQPSYYARGVVAGEHDYATACGSKRGLENRSFAMSFEKWKGRKPFLVRDHNVKTPTRMHVGRRFRWHGEQVECKSFNDEKGYFNAVKYKGHTSKVEKRFRITHEDIKAYHAALDGKGEPAMKGRKKAA